MYALASLAFWMMMMMTFVCMYVCMYDFVGTLDDNDVCMYGCMYALASLVLWMIHDVRMYVCRHGGEDSERLSGGGD